MNTNQVFMYLAEGASRERSLWELHCHRVLLRRLVAGQLVIFCVVHCGAIFHNPSDLCLEADVRLEILRHSYPNSFWRFLLTSRYLPVRCVIHPTIVFRAVTFSLDTCGAVSCNSGMQNVSSDQNRTAICVFILLSSIGLLLLSSVSLCVS